MTHGSTGSGWSQLRQALEELDRLPAMPEMARRLLQIHANPYATVDELTATLALDPSLAAQLMRHARSPLFGWRGSIDTLDDAIIKVLGFHLTLNMALGIALSGSLRMQRDGSLGLDAFWIHALSCATLCHDLGRRMPAEIRPPAGLPYLCGLLHNFGLLLTGHLFPQLLQRIETAWDAIPGSSLTGVELEILGTTHAEIGAWLMEQWHLPPEVITTVREHHNDQYSGINALYPRLVRVANHLLGEVEVEEQELDSRLLESLSLTEREIEEVLAQLELHIADLESLAARLAA